MTWGQYYNQLYLYQALVNQWCSFRCWDWMDCYLADVFLSNAGISAFISLEFFLEKRPCHSSLVMTRIADRLDYYYGR